MNKLDYNNRDDNNGDDGSDQEKDVFQDPIIIEEGKEQLPGVKEKLNVSVSFKSILISFLKQLALNPTDLHQLNCPPIILNGISLLEYSIYWADHPKLLFDIIKDRSSTSSSSRVSNSKNDHNNNNFGREKSGNNHFNDGIDNNGEAERVGKDPSMIRILKVARWFLSTLWGSYRSRNTCNEFERKPYNPILGEQFQCEWEDQIEMVSEQVCHHPPVSAFYFKTKDNRLHVNGYSGQKTAFTGTAIKVIQEGLITMNLFIEKEEEYQITLPELHIRGLLIGMPFLEITGETTIFCPQTGWKCHIKFLPKPWFTGEYDLIEGLIYKKKSSIDPESIKDKDSKIEIWGKWSDSIWYKIKREDETDERLISNQSTSSASSLYAHLEGIESGVLISTPQDNILYKVEEMNTTQPTRILDPPDSYLNSRSVWKHVTNALMEGDYDLASSLKNEIEEEQRQLRKERAERGVEWRPLMFERVDYSNIDDNDDDEEIITTSQRWVYSEFRQNFMLKNRKN